MIRVRAGPDALSTLRRACRFPGHVGHGWDACLDALRDLSWLPQPWTITITGTARWTPDDRATAVEVIDEARQFHEKHGLLLYIKLD